jgi:dTDP-4-dehydrorhamnose reductase
MKILVTGANGQLGADIVTSMTNAGQDVISLTHEDLDIGNLMEVKNQIMRVQPQVVINTAAFHNVDACEKDMAMAKRINTDAPGFYGTHVSVQKCTIHSHQHRLCF